MNDRHAALLRSLLAIPALLAALVACSATAGQPGEIMVMVTTDMSVPTDIDTLKWKVTVGGQVVTPQALPGANKSSECSPAKNSCFTLKTGEDLPATLALISGKDTTAPARFELDALHGGASGTVRVHREAWLELPREGVKTLAMPLSWLCTDANLSGGCAEGQTCQAGDCVDTALVDPAALPDFVPLAKSSCFDGQRCLEQLLSFAVPTVQAGECIVMGSETGGGVDVNVALVVNTTAVGNYGACSGTGGAVTQGKCLILLDRGTPEGWERLMVGDRFAGIRLPQAVCRGVGKSIDSVVIARATAECPTKDAVTPACDAPGTCLPRPNRDDQSAEVACPTTWAGYSCSGTVTPYSYDPEMLQCGEVGTDPLAGPVTAGLWCCASRPLEPPDADPLLIDDMTLGPRIKFKAPAGAVAGLWWTNSDDATAQISPPPPPALFTYRAILPASTAPAGPVIERAACFKSKNGSGFSGYFAAEGFDFAQIPGQISVVPVDVTRYTGIRFWAMSRYAYQGIKVGFPDMNTFAANTGGSPSTCNHDHSLGQCGDDWALQALTLSQDWTEYEVKWTDLTQDPTDWGQARFHAFDAKRVLSAYFAVNGPGPTRVSQPFDYCISQIRFTE